MNRVGWVDRARTVALALVVFALAHNLTFLLTYGRGSGVALTRTGHGPDWTVTVGLVGVLAVALVVAGLVRLAELSRIARDLDGRAFEWGDRWALARLIAPAWLQVLGLALAMFVGAENLEHVAVGLAAPGLSVFGSGEYHATIAVFVAVAFAAALVDALYRWRRDTLVDRIEAARARWARTHRSAPRPETPWLDRRHAATIGHRIAGRAPPATAV